MGTFLWPHSQQHLPQKELNQMLILSKVCGASDRYAKELALELIPHVRAAWIVAKDEESKQESILIDSCIHSPPSRFPYDPGPHQCFPPLPITKPNQFFSSRPSVLTYNFNHPRRLIPWRMPGFYLEMQNTWKLQHSYFSSCTPSFSVILPSTSLATRSFEVLLYLQLLQGL